MTHSEHLGWCQQQQQAIPCKDGKEWIHDALKAFLVVSDHKMTAAAAAASLWQLTDALAKRERESHERHGVMFAHSQAEVHLSCSCKASFSAVVCLEKKTLE